jgi:hypothetical protein
MIFLADANLLIASALTDYVIIRRRANGSTPGVILPPPPDLQWLYFVQERRNHRTLRSGVNQSSSGCRDSLIMSPYELDENVPIGVLLV